MPVASPEQNEARLAVLEAGHADLARDIARLEQAQLAGMLRLEQKLDRIEADLVDRPTKDIARSMARVWAFAGASFTGLVSAVVIIATLS